MNTAVDPTLSRTVVPSPLGDLTVVVGDLGVRAILFPEERIGRVRIDAATDGVAGSAHDDLLTRVATQLGEYFAGERTMFDLPLDLRGTEFQLRAWQAP